MVYAFFMMTLDIKITHSEIHKIPCLSFFAEGLKIAPSIASTACLTGSSTLDRPGAIFNHFDIKNFCRTASLKSLKFNFGGFKYVR